MYAKSWVFEGTNEDDLRHPDDISSVSVSSASPTQSNAPNSTKHNQTRRLSKLSDANSERFNPVMSSFSRCATPSPVPRSGQITPNHMPYTEYLDPTHAIVNHRPNPQKTNRLTVDYVPTTAVLVQDGTTTVTLKQITKTNIQSNGPPSVSSQQDDSQYASLLAELEQSLIDKKIQATNMSPDDTSLTTSTDKYCSSKSSSKDLEFSKELEAALQLIQELETPSEGPVDPAAAQNTKFARSESEKTLSAAVSLPSPEAAPFSIKSPDAQSPQNGKQIQRNIIRIEPSSQSTSGYSSPNSFSSNAQSSNIGGSAGSSASSTSSNSSGISGGREQVFTGDKANVVRIYIEPNGHCTNSNNLLTKGHILNASNLIETIETQSQASESLNKSFLLFKKRSKLMPHSDFQNRIFKSECLAYLTDEELVARHRCNRDVIRVRNSQAIFLFGCHGLSYF